MKKSFADRNFGFYILLAAAFVALAGAILYLALDGGDRTFTILGFLLALAGAVSTILAVLTRLKFAPLCRLLFMPQPARLCSGWRCPACLTCGTRSISSVETPSWA